MVRSALLATVLIGSVLATPVAARQSDAEATIEALQTQVAELEGMLTPTPTPTPAARETPANLDLVSIGPNLLLTYHYFIDDGDTTHLLGELENVGSQTVYGPRIVMVAYDEEGNVLGSIKPYSPIPALEPGETVPVEGQTDDFGSEEIGTSEFAGCETSWGEKDVINEGLKIEDLEEEQRDGDRFSLSGVIRNGFDVPVSGVKVNAIVYLEDGRFAGSDIAMPQTAIPAGKTARFELTAYGIPGIADGTEEYTYEVRASSDPNVSIDRCG